MKKILMLIGSMGLLTLSTQLLALEERFIDTGEAIILDNETGLMWTKDANLGPYRTVEAEDIASKFTLADYDDWRNPTELEASDLFNGLVEWGALDLFHDLHSYGCSYGNTVVFYASDGAFTFNSNTSCIKFTKAEVGLEVSLWLVRDGSPKRYSQSEVDTLVANAKASCESSNNSTTEDRAEYKNGVLTIPEVNVSDGFGGILTYQVTMDIVPLSDPVSFSLTGAVRK